MRYLLAMLLNAFLLLVHFSAYAADQGPATFNPGAYNSNTPVVRNAVNETISRIPDLGCGGGRCGWEGLRGSARDGELTAGIMEYLTYDVLLPWWFGTVPRSEELRNSLRPPSEPAPEILPGR
jgi:hypothetical protein